MSHAGSARSFLRVSDLTRDELEALLDLTAEVKADPYGRTDLLRGRTVACLFEKPSTRTRFSFAMAAALIPSAQKRPRASAISTVTIAPVSAGSASRAT